MWEKSLLPLPAAPNSPRLHNDDGRRRRGGGGETNGRKTSLNGRSFCLRTPYQSLLWQRIWETRRDGSLSHSTMHAHTPQRKTFFEQLQFKRREYDRVKKKEMQTMFHSFAELNQTWLGA